MLFYRVVHLIVARGSALLYRARIVGRERLPKTGGYILAPSHRSMMDIPFAAVVTPRRVRFMGKVQVFKIPVVGALFTALGGFPVQRDGTDRKAVRDSIDILHNGEPLVIYPEGTRQHGSTIAPLQRGAAYLAIRADVPIVPVGMAGTEDILRGHRSKLPHFGRVAMVVGEPIYPVARAGGAVKRDAVTELTDTLAKELQQVFDAANELRVNR
ncbi:MAG: 1-acyl-sn-glycerol-3-phosphate acyltransferase [Actinomycetia bacterium]|nr:1-acyl-sn-glycerol-3-phosphate acyltransferase [Actinomycetes bacterium]